MKNVLVVGASGATGRLLVQKLLQQDNKVVAIVRSSKALSLLIGPHENLTEVQASIADLSSQDLAHYLSECDAVLSCLGHSLTLKGMFGKPRLLVADTISKLCKALEFNKPDKRVKVILMNTTGNSNRDIPEKPPLSQRCVIALIRLLLPPHVDNEKAADFLRNNIGQEHACIEWVAVRPDSLTNEEAVTKYDILPSPTRNAIFDSAPTSRINVAHFMADLVADDSLWNTWKGQMPVIYNRT